MVRPLCMVRRTPCAMAVPRMLIFRRNCSMPAPCLCIVASLHVIAEYKASLKFRSPMTFTGALIFCAARCMSLPRCCVLLHKHMRRSQVYNRPDSRLCKRHHLPNAGCLTSSSLWFHKLLPHQLDGHCTAPNGDDTAPNLKRPLAPFLQALAIQKGACHACICSEPCGESH